MKNIVCISFKEIFYIKSKNINYAILKIYFETKAKKYKVRIYINLNVIFISIYKR